MNRRYHLNIPGELLLQGGFGTAAEQHRRLLNHRLLRSYNRREFLKLGGLMSILACVAVSPIIMIATLPVETAVSGKIHIRHGWKLRFFLKGKSAISNRGHYIIEP